MQSTIIELSQYTSNNVIQNGEWTNNLCKGVTVESGDYITVRNCMLDTTLVSQSAVVLDTDVEWVLQFVYYVMGHGIQQVINTIDAVGNNGWDGYPYILVEDTSGNPSRPGVPISTPIVDSFIVKIPKGTYDRDYLATYITRQFQGLGITDGRPANTFLNQMYYTRGSIYPIYNPDGTFNSFSGTYNPPTKPRRINTPFQRPLYTCPTEIEHPTNTQPKYVMNYNIPQPTTVTTVFSPCYYAPLCSNTPEFYSFKVYGFVTSGADLPKVGTDKQYTTGGVIGSSQVSLLYNDENNGKFSFQYIHNPIINQISGTNTEVVGMYSTAGVTTRNQDYMSYLDSFSGILFVNTYSNLSTDPNNDPWFNILGLSYSDIVPNGINVMFKAPPPDHTKPEPNGLITPGYNFGLDYLEFLRCTTRNYTAMSTIISPTVIKTTSDPPYYEVSPYNYELAVVVPSRLADYYFTDSPSTRSIIFSNVPTSNNLSAGHFLVDIMGYNSEYINEDQQLNIKAIVSSFFLSPDAFCVTMGNDGLITQWQGVATTLSSLKVRILNPITKQVDTTIGNRSTIYLQITKEKPTPPITDKSKEENKK